MLSQCLVTQNSIEATSEVTNACKCSKLLCIAFGIDIEGLLQGDRLVIVGDLLISLPLHHSSSWADPRKG